MFSLPCGLYFLRRRLRALRRGTRKIDRWPKLARHAALDLRCIYHCTILCQTHNRIFILDPSKLQMIRNQSDDSFKSHTCRQSIVTNSLSRSCRRQYHWDTGSGVQVRLVRLPNSERLHLYLTSLHHVSQRISGQKANASPDNTSDANACQKKSQEIIKRASQATNTRSSVDASPSTDLTPSHDMCKAQWRKENGGINTRKRRNGQNRQLHDIHSQLRKSLDGVPGPGGGRFSETSSASSSFGGFSSRAPFFGLPGAFLGDLVGEPGSPARGGPSRTRLYAQPSSAAAATQVRKHSCTDE